MSTLRNEGFFSFEGMKSIDDPTVPNKVILILDQLPTVIAKNEPYHLLIKVNTRMFLKQAHN